MSRHTVTRFSLALPVMMMSQAAFADVTAAQVWGDWKTYMEGFGYQINATETANGDNVTVGDLSMAMELPENEGTVNMSMGTVTFVQNGADVDVTFPDSMPITVNITPSGVADPMKMTFDYSQSGQMLKVSGSPDNMVYTYSADSLAMRLVELVADGGTFGTDNAKIDLTATGITSTTNMQIGDLRSYSQTGTMATLDYDIDIDNPAEAVKVAIAGGTTGVTFEGGGDIPIAGVDMADMAAMLKSGFAVAGSFSYGPGKMQMNVTDPANGDFVANSTSGGGSLGVEMGAQSLAYKVAQQDVKMNVKVAALPFPVELSMARSGFNLGMPIAASDVSQDFDFGIALGDFVMSDLIWSIFDPTAQLPRDPATIEVDLTGKAKLLIDIMDPEATASAATPGELQALTVGKILVSAAGASVKGNGDFTFDNTDLVTFDGMPKPVGAINVDVAGANGLMDKLVAMGLLPEQQAMGARMMMGLFAVPGAEPDTLKSKVEFTPDGQILANGQRIK